MREDVLPNSQTSSHPSLMATASQTDSLVAGGVRRPASCHTYTRKLRWWFTTDESRTRTAVMVWPQPHSRRTEIIPPWGNPVSDGTCALTTRIALDAA